MYRIFFSEKDCYITNKMIDGQYCTSSNVGKAGTIDIYKLYEESGTGVYEYSRGLIKFDIEELKNDFVAGKVDINSPKFECRLKLFDVYGGQTTPANFNIKVNSLTKNFDEGIGRDVVFYQDEDAANFVSCSYGETWSAPGAGAGGTLGTTNIDYIIDGDIGDGTVNLTSTQHFVEGEENLDIDVTQNIKGILLGEIPDNGFRISLIDSEEQDQKTRFVKRFATRDAADRTYHPQLVIKYDDSIRSDNKNLYFDNEGSLLLFNKVKGGLKNISYNGSQITGSNCLKFTITSGTFEKQFSASQKTYAGNALEGIYECSFVVSSSESDLTSSLENNDKLTFQAKWSTSAEDKIFFKEDITIMKSEVDNISQNSDNFIVTAPHISSEYKRNDVEKIYIHIERMNDPHVLFKKVPFITPSHIPEKVYYSIREAISGRVIIPFDDEKDSTRLSNDASSLWFYMPMSNLNVGLLYEIDIMIVIGDERRYYRNIASQFKISSNS